MAIAYSSPPEGGDLPPSYADMSPTQPVPGSSSSASHTDDRHPTDTKKRPALNGGPLGSASKSGAGADDDDLPPTFSEHAPQVYSSRKKGLADTIRVAGPQHHRIPVETSHILTHDAHLNEDGEALYRFLLKAAITPPEVTVRIRGWHEEDQSGHHHVGRSLDNNSHLHRGGQSRSNTRTVIDFDFKIDFTQLLLQPSIMGEHGVLPDPQALPVRHPVLDNPTVYVKRDEDIAYRGRMTQEVLVKQSAYRHASRARRPASSNSGHSLAQPSSTTSEDAERLLSGADYDLEVGPAHENLVLLKPSWSERRALKRSAATRWLPWTKGVDKPRDRDIAYIRRSEYDDGVKTERLNVGDGSWPDSPSPTFDVKVRPAEGLSGMTARMVCDEYTLIGKELKSFRVKKRVAGWDIKAFEDAIKKIVEEVFPTSMMNDRHIEVKFNVDDDTVTVLPDNELSRFLTTLQRTHGAKRVLLIVLLIFTGAFIIVLPAAWILRQFKGARYNTVGIVWQLSQWEEVTGNPRTDYDAQEQLLEQERQEAARSGAPWAFKEETRAPAPLPPSATGSSSSANSNPAHDPTSYVTASGPMQQPFLLARLETPGEESTSVLAHRGIRQGDVVKTWEARIRSNVVGRVQLGHEQRLGQDLSAHLPQRERRTFDPLTGHESVQQM
ncbi:hypothetical protein CF326_g3711 [Tilletia indica]|nr:hypothetical protein CF326_g3711 [Tilletia indica]